MKTRIFSLLLTLVMLFSASACGEVTENHNPKVSYVQEGITKEESSSEEMVSSEVSSITETSSAASSQTVTSKPTVIKPVTPKPQSSAPATVTPPLNDYKYTTNIDINDNVFMDSLVYTGYNIKKHRSDVLMWVYILASQKRAKGWLSKIGYNGIATGYETNSLGKPDINYFIQKRGLVCASYVTYVYFNYLPNVAGINTNFLDKPVKPQNANDWYNAVKKWVSKGYSKSIKFKASLSGSRIKFTPSEQIPIGSVLVFCSGKSYKAYGSHVCIYAGYANGNNWVFHVGNDNGPEFCSVERMSCGPDPQWPIMVVTPPMNIRMAACLDITLTDSNNTPISGVAFKATNKKTNTVYNIGSTANNGKIVFEGLPYGNYILTHTAPAGYTAEKPSLEINLNVKNNSVNKVTLIDKKPEPIPTPTPESSQSSSTTTEPTNTVE